MAEVKTEGGIRGTMLAVENKVYDYVLKIRIGNDWHFFAAYPHKSKKGSKITRLQILGDHDGLVDEKTKKEMEALGL